MADSRWRPSVIVILSSTQFHNGSVMMRGVLCLPLRALGCAHDLIDYLSVRQFQREIALMNRTVLRAVLFIALGFGFVQPLEAQELPENWQQLPVEEFANAVAPFYDASSKRLVGDFDEEAVRKHAAAFFLDIDLAQAPLSEFPVILKLYHAGWRALTKEQIADVREKLAARQDDWTGRPYEEMRSKVGMMGWVDVPLDLISQEVHNWVDLGGDVSTVWDKDLHYYSYYMMRDPKVVTSNFSVKWEGRVTAPQTGQYTFSISPINVNAKHRDYNLEQTMTVSVGGQQIISATPDNWNSEAQPVQLTAGQSVPLRVDLTVTTPRLPSYALHAVLAWEGPGISKSIVPNLQLKLPSTDDYGLRGTYVWTEDGQEKSVIKVDKTIDFSWVSGEVAIANDTTGQVTGSALAWQRQTATAYLDGLEAAEGPARLHPWLANPLHSSQGLTSAQRKAYLEILLTRPALLDPLNSRATVDLYRAFRMGAEEEALDVFGQWALRNASCECVMPDEPHLWGVDLRNREAYHEMAVAVSQELPGHTDRLRDEFLELPDGSCCLPVAYVLAYSYLGRDKFKEWNDLLADKLALETSTGDRRVNWLIAAAHAREIRLGARQPRALVYGRPLDGRVFLDEAAFTAQDPDVKVRVAKELAARLTSVRRYDQARERLDEAAVAAPAGRTADVAKWRAQIDQYEAAHAQKKLDDAEAAKQAHLSNLRERRDRAALKGNDAAVSRYDALINAFEE